MRPELLAVALVAKRAAPDTRVMGVARFSEPGVREALVEAGVEPVAADLLDRAQLEKLPKAANVVLMAGRKCGAAGDVPLTWALNVQVPAMVAEVFKDSRIVAFDFGIKWNILRRLRQAGFDVEVLNSRTSAEAVLA